MATQAKEKTASKNDAFIEGQLARAQNRIRLIDLTAALLGFVAGTLAFLVLMILVDRRFVLGDAARQAGLIFYLVAAALYLALAVVRPLRWRVNPHYAARQLEQTLSGSRNHVINWIDLHGEKVPAILKNSLGQRAAKDLTKTDVDQAISSRRALAVGGTAGFFAAVFLVLFVLFGPRPFASLLARTFAPFGKGSGIASRTQVDILRPESRDAIITIGNPITIVASVTGRIPSARDKDAPCLLYRHQEDEPYRKRFLQPDESSQEWSATVGPLDVGNGFFYKVAAGDAETPEYRISVRAAPLISDFLATYRFRDYVNRGDLTQDSRRLEALRGTRVTITARTNRIIRDGRLDFEGADGVGDLIRAEPDLKDPQSLIFRMVLDRAGKYRIRFTSTDSEVYIDSTPSDVRVIPDLPPQVRITEPAKDVTLPANGQLELKGEASDDIGVARLTLRLQVVGGQELKPKPYMADKLGQPNYGTPRTVDYRDLLELSSLQDQQGGAANLKPGMEIEYWLEAADACDYHRPNVTASQPRYKIKIDGPPANEAQQQKEREEARKRQKEHEAQQAEQMKKEKAERQEERKKEDQQQKEEDRKRQEEQNKKNKPSETKKPEDGKEKGKPESKDGGQGDSKKEADTRKQAEELKEKLDKKAGEQSKEKSEQEKRGEGRGAEENRPGKGKDEGEKKPGEDKGGKDNKPGEKKEGSGQDGKNPAGEKKEGGKPGEQGSARSEGKPDGKDQKGEGKQGAGKAEAGKQPGQGKEGPAPKKPGEGKDQGKGDPGKGAGERKPASDPKPGDNIRRGEARDAKTTGKPTDLKPNEGKDGSNPAPQPPPGEGKGKCEKGGQGKPGAGAKQGGGQGKPSGQAGEPGAKPGEKKGDGGNGKGSRPEEAKPSDVDDLARDLKGKERLNQRETKRKLQDIQDKAKDPQAREAAKKALEEAKKDDQPGQGKPDTPGGDGPGEKVKKGEQKPGNGGANKEAGQGKGGDLPGDPTDPAGKEGAGSAPGKGKDSGEKTGEGPGDGSQSDRRQGGGGRGESPPAKPEKPAAHRASMMQLEEFRKKVDKDVLKDAKMSREQFEQFLRDYAELAKKQPKADEGAAEVIAPPQTSSTLPSMVGRTTQGKGKNEDVRGEGRPKPPPGYRDSYRDFVQRLNKQPK